MRFICGFLGLAGWGGGGAYQVIRDSGPKGWITIGVVAALVIAAFIQEWWLNRHPAE